MTGFLDSGDTLSLNDYQSLMGYSKPIQAVPSNANNLFGVGTNGVIGVSTNVPMSVASPTSNWWDGMLGYKRADGTQVNGWGGLALGVGQGLFNGYLGMQQLGVAKDSLQQSKDVFNKNYAAQKQMTNARLDGRYSEMAAAQGLGKDWVAEKMSKYGIA